MRLLVICKDGSIAYLRNLPELNVTTKLFVLQGQFFSVEMQICLRKKISEDKDGGAIFKLGGGEGKVSRRRGQNN